MARAFKRTVKLSLRRVRINTPSIRYKPDSSSIERDQRIEFLSGNGDDPRSSGEESKAEEHKESEKIEVQEEEEEEEEEEIIKVMIVEEKKEKHQEEKEDIKSFANEGVEKIKEAKAEVVEAVAVEEEEVAEGGNRVMVVVDKALASTGALEWAISHTLQSQDTLFLLYFAKPFTKGKRKNRKREVKTDELVHTLKKLCQTKRPGIEVEIRRLEGKDKEKGEKIVEEAKKQQVSLLVVGQDKKPPVWRLLQRWTWKRRRGHGGVLKYCLENASCMTIAVKPKNRKLGGYLITTKRHKNFWLLA